MTDDELAQKYQLTPGKLEFIFNKLLEAKAISAAEIEDRRGGRARGPYPEMPSDFRISVREKLDFPLAVYEKDMPDIRGLLRDISEQGVGVKGIEAAVGDQKTLIIPAHELFHINPIEIEVICRWVATEGSYGDPVGGFEIVNLIEGSMEDLQMLIRTLPLEDRIAMRKKL
jgi:hypothetical protein